MGGVHDHGPLRGQAVGHVHAVQQRLVHDDDIIRVFNVAVDAAPHIADAVVGGDGGAHALRAVLRKALDVFAGAERGVSQKQAGGLGPLTAAAMPAELDQSVFFHRIYKPPCGN